ncbi:hypothetical protein MTBBW1_1090006 [Desulfamplus magnetovallimortis]|uniref:Fibronectin type-III domain-containing protein n=1 Tax=Desulfamplus magnetovallimortis TaxID=1246637 RepID=A0A1W1H5Q7_9BACT|nr:hypothetical protein [Desulfamplus magnetovallimortis]SLM27715.1 hypothetical protein MTBBW1_1090006 [Desulfamplus magnetovallimortis]
MQIGWTNGSGTRRAVFVLQGDAGQANPVNDTTYTADTAFESGTQIDATGWYCVYNGTGTSVTITGLTGNINYRVMVCEYFDSNGSQKYLTSTAADNPKNQSTLAAEPTAQASDSTFSTVSGTSMTIGWTAGTGGTGRLVLVKSAGAVDSNPVDGTAYTANAAFGSGTEIATGNYVVMLVPALRLLLQP